MAAISFLKTLASAIATPLSGYASLFVSTGPVLNIRDDTGALYPLSPTATEQGLFAQTAMVTVANTTTETTLVGAGVGSVVLPAALSVAGQTLNVEAWGYHSATLTPTIRIRVYKGATLLLDTGAVLTFVSTNALIQIRATITWRSPTSVSAQGFYQESGGGVNNFPMVTTAPITVSSAAEALNVTAQWGTASVSDTITLTNLTVRTFNGV
jgi:hypothetical protein